MMLTLVLALLAALLLARSWEGSIRINGLFSNWTIAQLGRVGIMLYVFRPAIAGRPAHVYARLEVLR